MNIDSTSDRKVENCCTALERNIDATFDKTELRSLFHTGRVSRRYISQGRIMIIEPYKRGNEMLRLTGKE